MAINEIGLPETVTVGGTTVNVKDPPYNAVGDDVANDTVAFRNALNAIRNTGGTCFVPAGTYKISPDGIMQDSSNRTAAISSDMHLVGEVGPQGRPVSILHIHNKATAVIIPCKGSNWSIEKIGILMSGVYEYRVPMPTGKDSLRPWIPGAGPITVLAGQGATNGWKIDRCDITHPAPKGGHYCIVARGSYWTISNCNLTNFHDFGTGAHPLHEGINVTAPAGVQSPSHSVISGNNLLMCGMGVGGNNMKVIGNHVSACGLGSFFHGAGLVSNDPSNNHSNIYAGNSASFNREGPDDTQSFYDENEVYHEIFQPVGGYEVWAPYTLFFNNTAHDNCGTGFNVGGHHSVVAFNSAVDNGRIPADPDLRHSHAEGLSVRILAQNKQVSGRNSLLLGNHAVDTRPAGQKTQDHGIVIQSNDIRCVASIQNDLHGNNVGDGNYRLCQPNVNVFKGRDMWHHLLDEKQRTIVLSLLDSSDYRLSEPQYVMLNQLLTGSGMDRPVQRIQATEETDVSRWRFTSHWTATNTAIGYQVTVARDIGFNNVVDGYDNLDVHSVLSLIVTVPHNELQIRTYYYRVRGYNNSGVGPYSNIITVTMPPE